MMGSKDFCIENITKMVMIDTTTGEEFEISNIKDMSIETLEDALDETDTYETDTLHFLKMCNESVTLEASITYMSNYFKFCIGLPVPNNWRKLHKLPMRRRYKK